eukprot:gene40232-64091_t
MANCGLPATAGFVGEWMVILGAVKFNFWIGFAAATALIFGAAYTLWMYKRVYLGPVVNDDVKNLTDINAREFLMLAMLAIATLYMGLYPKPFTDVMNSSVVDLLAHNSAMIDKLSRIAVHTEIILAVMACVILLVDLGVKSPMRTVTYVLTLITLAVVAALEAAY